MEGFIIVLHSIACIFLIGVVLMQSGRKGGLTESMVAAESMFGAQTNVFMVKATAILASIFIFTSLSLAILSAKKERSLMASPLDSILSPEKDKADFEITIPITTNAVTP